MEVEFNVTYLTFGGHAEVHKYRYLLFMVMFLIYIFIICSNLTIIRLIWIHQNLHEPMYFFIAALSLNSVLFSTALYPKLLIDFLSEKQIISYSACAFQSFIFYSLGGSDFLLLAAMAYDRYVSICKPLHYAAIMHKKTVIISLGLAWLVPTFHLVVSSAVNANKKICKFTVNGIFCNNSISKLHCVRSNFLSVFGLVILVDVAILPVFFIFFTYTKIFIIAHRSSGEVKKKAAETCVPHLLVLFCFLCLCAYDVISARLESYFSRTVIFVMSIQVVLYNPLLNPIIYGVKMREISKHLKKLFVRTQHN